MLSIFSRENISFEVRDFNASLGKKFQLEKTLPQIKQQKSERFQFGKILTKRFRCLKWSEKEKTKSEMSQI